MIAIGDPLYIVECECVHPRGLWLACYQDGPRPDSPPLAIFATSEEAEACATSIRLQFPGSNYRVTEGTFKADVA